ncbi:chaperonin 10-like protein [Plectosphaerella plurivora]|uniref:Chaperonin 10-like protein n=1 Tax=Plectosphaerella plurivora TaxID=936078 RepID=A0A9P8V1E1_9PEZI|nr:chaperonin 10-like protein [Plectosphaerella plurivora]
MRAFQFLGVDEGLQLRDIPVPKPPKDHALIQVKAAGLCHSDTHVLHGGGAGWMCALPVVLGHEIAGTIIELGEGSTGQQVSVGDRVAVACVGHPIQERNFQEALGVGCDGGYAEYAVAPIKNLVQLPEAVSFAQAAVATDSVATSYHAVVTEGLVDEHSTVCVIGLGGLGLNGVAIAAARGATVYGIDISEAKFDPSRRAGAVDCATSLDDFSDKAFDVILDFAGAEKTVNGALSAVKLGGTVVLVGLAASTVQITTTDIVTKNVSLKGSTSASIQELREVLDMIAAGQLSPQIEEVPFQDVPASLERLGSGEVTGRLYTTP